MSINEAQMIAYAALPDEATPGNSDEVRAQFEEILALYRELTGEEQG